MNNTHYSKSRTKKTTLKLLKSSRKEGKEKYEQEHYPCPPKNVCSHEHNSGSVLNITHCVKKDYIDCYFLKREERKKGNEREKTERIKIKGEGECNIYHS
jgi:hypothetical protein